MSILLNKDTKVLVQGITGSAGRAQTKFMLEYGTKIVAGVTPGKGGESVFGIPVYDSVKEAVKNHCLDASVFFVPAPFVKDTIYETIEAGIKLIVVITEHIPLHDTLEVKAYAKKEEVRMLGPTTPGIITPGEAKIGIMPGNMFSKGNIGIVSRSGTLAYEVAGNLMEAGLGQSTVVGLGADPVVFTDLPEILELFEKDEETKLVVIVGEVGGVQEEMGAEFIKEKMTKPVIAYIAGKNAPEGKRMGHAGAIIQGGRGTARSKVEALEKAGVRIAETPALVPGICNFIFGS